MTPDTDRIDTVVRIARALRSAGIDVWTAAHHQECPCLMLVTSSGRPGYVRLSPMFTAQGTGLEVPVDVAVAAIGEAADLRLDTGVDPFEPATEGEAREVWRHVVAAARPELA